VLGLNGINIASTKINFNRERRTAMEKQMARKKNQPKTKKLYAAPQLTTYGQVEKLTQAKAAGSADKWGS
jgi:hypothetical protein